MTKLTREQFLDELGKYRGHFTVDGLGYIRLNKLPDSETTHRLGETLCPGLVVLDQMRDRIPLPQNIGADYLETHVEEGKWIWRAADGWPPNAMAPGGAVQSASYGWWRRTLLATLGLTEPRRM